MLGFKTMMVYTAAVTPITSFFQWLQSEAQSAVGIGIIIWAVYLFAKRKASEFVRLILIGGGAAVFILSPTGTGNWLKNLIAGAFGIS